MLSCPYQGIFTQSTKFTENVWEKLSKVFFRKMHATLFECSENYLFQCLTYHKQCKVQQKKFCKNYTSRIHSRRNLPNILTFRKSIAVFSVKWLFILFIYSIYLLYLFYFWDVYEVNLWEKNFGRSTAYSCRANVFI